MSGDLYNLATGIVVIGSSASPGTLTAGYTDTGFLSGVVNVGKASNVSFGVNYTMGTAETSNTIQFKFEVSNDKTTWYRLQTELAVTGTVTRTDREDTYAATAAAGTYNSFKVNLENLPDRYLKITFKETGEASNFGSLWVVASKWGR